MTWIWLTGRMDESDITIDELPSIMVTMGLDFGSGVKQVVKVPEFVVSLKAHQTGALNDALALAGGVLMSPRLRAAVEAAGVGNIQWFPVVLVPQGAANIRGYSLANVLDPIPCIDLQRSRLKLRPNGSIRFIDSLVIREEAFGSALMARPAEYRSIIVVADRIKQAIEACGATGVKFRNPADLVL